MNQSIDWKIFFQLQWVPSQAYGTGYCISTGFVSVRICELLTAAISIQAKDSIDPTLDSRGLHSGAKRILFHRQRIHLQDEPITKRINTAYERSGISFSLQHFLIHYCITTQCFDPRCSS